jgi:hypothetical protein
MGVGEISVEMQNKKRKIDGSRAFPAFKGSGTVLEKGIEIQRCGVSYLRRHRSYILFV